MRTERLSRLGIDHVSRPPHRASTGSCGPRRSESRSGRSPLPRASPHEAGPWSEEKASPCRSCRTGPHPGAAGPGGAGLLCRHVRPNTTRHLFPRSPVDLTGGAPTFWSLQRRCLRSWRRAVGRRRADSGCSLAGPHVRARVCPDPSPPGKPLSPQGRGQYWHQAGRRHLLIICPVSLFRPCAKQARFVYVFLTQFSRSQLVCGTYEDVTQGTHRLMARRSVDQHREEPDPEDLLAVFAASLKAARMKRGLTQAQLAERAGLLQQYVSLIEQGKQNVTLTTAQVLARVLRQDVSDMLRGAAPGRRRK